MGILRPRSGLGRCTRRAVLLGALLTGLSASAWAQVLGQAAANARPPADGRMVYRGFRIQAATILSSPQYAAIMASMPHQIDIVMDCGLRPEVIRFLQTQMIVVRPGLRGQFGHFNPGDPGVSIEDAVAAPQKPIVLHELLHAYHWHVIPGGFRNPEIMTFYERATNLRRYPDGAYLMKWLGDFFGVQN